MNRTQRRQLRRQQPKGNAMGQTPPGRPGVIDLQAIKDRKALQAATPEYTVTEFEFVTRVGVEMSSTGVPLRDALDGTARDLALDGWRIESVKRIAVVSVEPPQEGVGPVGVFQVELILKPAPTTSGDTNAEFAG